MKVLLITGSYPPMKCGVGSYTKRLSEALAELNEIKVSVLTDERACEPLQKLDNVEVMAVIKCWNLTELLKIIRHVIKINPDIVHIQYPTQGYVNRIPYFLPLLMFVLRKHCVQTWHEPITVKVGFCLTIGLKQLISVRENLMSIVPEFIRFGLANTRLSWIPGACLLPTIYLSNEQRLEIRNQYCSDDKKLLVFYGFIAPLKGMETLFEVIAKTGSQLLLVCDFQTSNPYHTNILEKIKAMQLESQITITGFLPDEQLARILAAADAVVLPFRDGSGPWNTSIDGAVAQGTFVLTTSLIENGYEPDKNIYFAKPGNVDEMIAAHKKYAGFRAPAQESASKWRAIAEQHRNIYRDVCST